MLILGVNADQADVSAALVGDGRLLAAVEEERFTRIKHCTGFPAVAVERCLSIAGVTGDQVDRVAVCGNPRSHLARRALFAMATRPRLGDVSRRARRIARDTSLPKDLAGALGISPHRLPPIHRIEHHPAHLASAFYVSPFESAAVCSADGVGDLVSTSIAHGTGDELKPLGNTYFPHSLGGLYTAVTQYLGFHSHGDEYKVMALAALGRPRYVDRLREVITLLSGGGYRLDRSFFQPLHAQPAAGDAGRSPRRQRIFSAKLEQLLGPTRDPDEPLDTRHRDTARSLQDVFEDAAVHVLRELSARTGEPRLCLAGGCFMNSALNGRIEAETSFENVFIQPAAGDNGTALGAAYAVWRRVLGKPREFVMEHAYTGTEYSDRAIRSAIDARREELRRHEISVHRGDPDLCGLVARSIAEGNVAGWFQGRMEWGSRALGNRSLLADPRDGRVRERINSRIKRREAFRPFAPSIIGSAVGEYFSHATADPFMLRVHPVRPAKRGLIPAVVHVDGSSRPHAVTREANPRYFELLREFERITGVPVLLNTSLNENEPIVESPAQAIDCYLRTGLDLLVIGDTVIRSPHGASGRRD